MTATLTVVIIYQSHGIEHESAALQQYTNYMKHKGRLHDRAKKGTDPTKTGTVPTVFAKKQ